MRGRPDKPGQGWLAVFVPSHGKVPEHFHPTLDNYLDLPVREAALGIKPDFPILISPGYELDPLLIEYFLYGDEYTARNAKTQKDEASAIKAWLNYLDSLGVHWSDATRKHFTAFRAMKTDRHLVQRLVAAGRMSPTDGRDVITMGHFGNLHRALKRLYEWAEEEGHVPRGRSAIPSRVLGHNETPKSRAAGGAGWFMPTTFVLWRNVGLLGHTVVRGDNGLPTWGPPDRSWKGGRNASRNAAYVDLGISTGLRRRELTLLTDEVGAGQQYLAARMAKGEHSGRKYEIPRGIADEIERYERFGRRAAVRRARRAGRYEKWQAEQPPLLIFDHWDWDRYGARVFVAEDGVEVSLNDASVEERMRMARRTEEGIEPMMLWLKENGLPHRPEGWNPVIDAANKRVAHAFEAAGIHSAPPYAIIHTLRRSFALYKLAALSRQIAKREGLAGPALLAYDMKTFGPAFKQVQGDLGHASSQTTIDQYLEPVKGLLHHAYFDTTSEMALEEVISLLVGDSPLVQRLEPSDEEGA
jgi:hypothetical protein